VTNTVPIRRSIGTVTIPMLRTSLRPSSPIVTQIPQIVSGDSSRSAAGYMEAVGPSTLDPASLNLRLPPPPQLLMVVTVAPLGSALGVRLPVHDASSERCDQRFSANGGLDPSTQVSQIDTTV
jgi:hypothetical protein